MSFFSRFDTFHERAAQATGLSDFGPSDYIEPMQLILMDYDKYGSFTASGEQITNDAVTGLLIARLLAQQGFKTHPAYAATPIEKPIVICGMPRTGTTSLHRLLCNDPDTQCLVPWLGNTPMPRPSRGDWESNPWFQMTKQGLDAFWKIYPSVKSMHPVLADEADECRFALEPSFWSPAFAVTGPLQGRYAEWVSTTQPRYAYAYYRKVLGLISGGDQRRWILKDPTTHPWAPEMLFETFPDACYVYTHRDPAQAMASVIDMVYTLRKVRMSRTTPGEHAREQIQFWAQGINRLDAALRRLPASRIIDIHIDELRADPVGIAQKIYRHFGIPITEAAHRAWLRHAELDPRSGHGQHRYAAESIEIRSEDVYAAIPQYYDRYRRFYGSAKGSPHLS